MSGVDDIASQVAQLDEGDKRAIGALLLIRYCGWYGDPKFEQWFVRARDAFVHVTSAAREVLRGDEVDLEGLRVEVEEALDASDPDGPPFEAEFVDHLVFATEVLDFLLATDESDALTQAFERADELAEAHDEMAEEELPGGHELASVGFFRREADAREADSTVPLDRRAALVRSEEFAGLYARVIELSYSEEDAGMARPHSAG